jgi:2,3,4,5-tetrahydropyridine-2-carboxylate N-succinyltransferase
MTTTDRNIQRSLIENAFDQKIGSPDHSDSNVRDAVFLAIAALNDGRLRVVDKTPDGFTHNEWLKKAILLYFRMQKMSVMEAGDLRFVDKIPLKKWRGDEGVRVVPGAIVREGAFVSPNAILMPSFVNIGAFVGTGTMVDTWATVGSCAYVGNGVHLSGGVGIGGVLEPIQARPVIIEDDHR